MSLATAIRFRKIRKLVRSAIRTRSNILVISLIRLRMALDLPMPGEDKTQDEKLYDSISNFYDLETNTEKITEENKDYYFLDWLAKSEYCDNLRKEYIRISYWLATSQTERENIEKFYRRIYEVELNPLNDLEVRILHVTIRKELSSTKRSWNMAKAQRLDLRLKDLTLLIPLVSVALVFAGYFHTSVVYTSFGIDPTRFFSAGDYLAASLEQIPHVWSLIVGYLAGVVHGIRQQSLLSGHGIETHIRERRVVGIASFVLGSAGLAVSYWYWSRVSIIPGVHIWIVFCLFIALQAPLRFLADRYFENSNSTFIFSVVLLLFFGSAYVGSHVRIAEIKSKKIERTFEIKKGEIRYTQETSKIIGANSRYVFIWNRQSRVNVVPLTSLDHISFSNR